MASLLLGYPAATFRSKALVSGPGFRANEAAAFIQDDWRITRRLTLNLGLRYDYFSPFSEVANRASNADPYAERILVAG
jgi:outer membrane receptor protein involved in Fe transport